MKRREELVRNNFPIWFGTEDNEGNEEIREERPSLSSFPSVQIHLLKIGMWMWTNCFHRRQKSYDFCYKKKPERTEGISAFGLVMLYGVLFRHGVVR